MDKNDLWIIKHFSELVSEYAGRYIAVANERVVSSGESAREVEAEAMRAAPETTPSVILVPREEDMACLL